MSAESKSNAPHIFISTGDLSGDMHASHLVQRIRREWEMRFPEKSPIRFSAAGSSHLVKSGAEIWEDTTFWGAMGIFEGIKILPELLAAKKRLVKRIRDEKPELVITVDYRSFNMSLLKDIRKRRDGSIQKTAYYISPVLWGSGNSESLERKSIDVAVETAKKIPGLKKGARDRFEAMAELCDLALVAYPFSLEHYERAGVNYRYIGHPLAQIALEAAAGKKNFDRLREKIGDRRLVCIAPGSRKHELNFHMPVLLELIERLKKRYDNLWFYCPVPDGKFGELIMTSFGNCEIEFVPDDCYDLMAESDLMVVKSGTSVQLALILAVPAVTFYKITNEFMENIGKRFFQNLPYYAFPNLLAGAEVIPEFMQSNFMLANLYVACTELLDDPVRAGHMRAELMELRKKTMKDDPIGEASKLILDLIS